MANRYDLELAIDTYRAQNGKDSEIGLFGDQLSGFEYGSNRFSSREQAVWWLKQQKPNHEDIKKMIAEERAKFPNSGLNPLFEVYERYYPQVQQVQQNTRTQLETQKPGVQVDTKLQNTSMKLNKDIRILNEDGKIDMGPQALSASKDSEVSLTGNKKSIDGFEYVEFSKIIIAGKIYEQKGWVKLVDLTDVNKVSSEASSGKTENKPSKTSSLTTANKPKSNVTPSYKEQVLVNPKTGTTVPPVSHERKEVDSNKQIQYYLTLALAAVRDEIREAKKVTSWRWSAQDSKMSVIAQIDELIDQSTTLTEQEMVQRTFDLLSKAETRGVINKDQSYPLQKVYTKYDSKNIKEASIAIIRASNGSTQMHELFYQKNKAKIDEKVKNFSEAEKEQVNKQVQKVLDKMNSELSKIAEREWSAHKDDIQKKAPDIKDAGRYKDYLVTQYRQYMKADFGQKFAVKLLGEDVFKNSDADLWYQYDQAVDPMDKWWTISDESATGIANFIAYDLTSMLIAGGVAGLVGRGFALATRGMLGAERVAQITYGAGGLNSTTRTIGGVSRAVIEGTTFTAAHAAIRNQEWFTSQPDWEQQIIINSLGFGLFRSAQSGAINNLFSGIKNPAINGLVKQGLVIPAIITGVQVGAFDYDRLRDKDPGAWNDIWSNFLLNAAMGGLFHFAARPGAKVNTDSIVAKEGFIKLQDCEVPMRQNSDGTITLTVPGKNGTLQGVTFVPSKQVQVQINQFNNHQTQQSSPASAPSAVPNIQNVGKYSNFDVVQSKNDLVNATVYTTKKGSYEYAFYKDNGTVHVVRRPKSGGDWVEYANSIPATLKPKSTPSSMNTAQSTPPVGVNSQKVSNSLRDDFANQLWKFDKKAPESQKIGDYELVYDKAKKRILAKKGNEETLITSKEQLNIFLQQIDEGVLINGMKGIKSTPAFESQFKIGNAEFILTKEGKLYKNNQAINDIGTLSGAELEGVFGKLYASENGKIFLETAKAKFASGGTGIAKGVWHLASVPWHTNGLMSIPAFAVNLARLPFINAHEFYNTIVATGMTKTKKFQDIVKILTLANKNGFDGFVNSVISVTSSAAIIYSTYQFVQEKQAKGELPKDMSWAGETWAITHRYLQSVNIWLPYDAWVDIFKSRPENN